jgi:hypothetical protein
MPQEAQALVQMLELLDGFDEPAQQRMVQYLVSKYGLGPSIVREYERDRKASQRLSGTMSGTTCPGQENQPPSPKEPERSSKAFKASKRLDTALGQEDLDKAKALLKPEDFEFLQACPEPFRTAWLGRPDWWLSLRDGYPRIAAQAEASRCMAWVESKFSPAQVTRLNLRSRLRSWFAKAEFYRLQREERQAVKR